jgi:HEAT repeat protein
MKAFSPVGLVTLGLGLLTMAPPWAMLAQEPGKASKKRDVEELVKILRDGSKEGREQAFLDLIDLGLGAEPALPALLDVLKKPNEEERVFATLAIAETGNAAVPALAALLNDEDESLRYHAIWALGLIGPKARRTIPAVLRALEDADEEVRCKVVFALPRLGTEADEAVPALIKRFRDSDADVGEMASKAAAQFGEAAVPHLVKALEDPESAWRAVEALGGIGPDAHSAIPALCRLLTRMPYPYPPDQEGEIVLAALRKIGGEPWPEFGIVMKRESAVARAFVVIILSQLGDKGVPLLLEALDDPAAEVRHLAAHCLGSLRAPGVVAGLHRVLLDADERVRETAFASLIQQGDEPLLLLRDCLKKGKSREQIHAAGLLMRHSPVDAPAAATFLGDSLKMVSPELRFLAAYQLATRGRTVVVEDGRKVFKMGQEHAKIIPILLDHLQNEKAGDRGLAASALGGIGVAGKHMPQLYKALLAKDKQLRMAVLEVLRQAVPKKYSGPPDAILTDHTPIPDDHWTRADAATLTAVVPLLKDEDRDVRSAALEVVLTFGKDAVPHLPFFLRDRDWQLRDRAFNSLINMKGSGAKAAPLLRRLAKEEELKPTFFHIAHCLATLAPEESFPYLLEAQQKRDKAVRQAVQEAGAASDKSQDMIVALQTSLTSTDWARCRRAAYALSQLSAFLAEKAQDDVKEMLAKTWKQKQPELAKALKAKDAGTRREAAALLIQLARSYGEIPFRRVFEDGGVELQKLREDLLVLLDTAREDTDLEVRRQARKALRKNLRPAA